MKKPSVYLFSLMLPALLCLGAESKPEAITLRPAPHKMGDIAADSDWVILPRSELYEVGASKLQDFPIPDLPETGFLALNEAVARRLTGEYYTCPAGKHPYLIKAIYGKRGAVGQFRAERKGNSIVIVWGAPFAISIQQQGAYERSAVVVNLDFAPEQIYTEFSCTQ